MQFSELSWAVGLVSIYDQMSIFSITMDMDSAPDLRPQSVSSMRPGYYHKRKIAGYYHPSTVQPVQSVSIQEPLNLYITIDFIQYTCSYHSMVPWGNFIILVTVSRYQLYHQSIKHELMCWQRRYLDK